MTVGVGSAVKVGVGAGVAAAALHAIESASTTMARPIALRRGNLGLGFFGNERSWNLIKSFGEGNII